MSEVTRRVQNEPAYVLHRRPYRETSMLLDLLTPSFGRIGAVARGVRGGARVRTSVRFEPFTRLLVTCSGRGALLTVNAVEAVTYGSLAGPALFAGLYLNELLVRVLRADDAHPSLFAGYDLALDALAQNSDLEPALRRFEKLVLKESGYEISFHVDADTGEPVRPDLRYRFIPELGFTTSQGSGESGLVFDGAVLLAVGEDRYDELIVRRAAKRIMRRALAPYLGERPLASRSLFAGSRFIGTSLVDALPGVPPA